MPIAYPLAVLETSPSTWIVVDKNHMQLGGSFGSFRKAYDYMRSVSPVSTSPSDYALQP